MRLHNISGGATHFLCLLAFASFSFCARLGYEVEENLALRARSRVILYAQASGDETEDKGRTYQRTRKSEGSYSAEYGFQNFNQDALSVRFELKKPAFEAYDAEFGYSDKELSELKAWHERERQSAYQLAVKAHKTQAQLDTALAGLKSEYERKVRRYMASRGFALLPGNMIAVDMPALVRKNTNLLKPLALAFDRIATERKYDSESLIGAATSLVQTALLYKIPPALEGGRHTGGLLPPLKALLNGWGDCDTKTGLLASLLANWPHMRMVGIAVPGHYLMGILRIPGKGDMYVEYEGLQYVLIEPAGPAWLAPGTVGRDTVPLLEASQGYQIEPFF